MGVRERLEFEQSSSRTAKTSAQPLHLPPSSRRRKGASVKDISSLLFLSFVLGPAFLPSEHNELPPGVAFMVTF